MKSRIKILGTEILLPIIIQDMDDYLAAKERGFEPLLNGMFFVNLSARVEIISAIFGKPCPQNDNRFYRWMWDHKPHVCEEYLCPLYEYSAVHISHILSKGSNPIMRYDPRNINILSFKAHNEWEYSDKRKRMNIWPQNEQLINTLKNEYSQI